MGLKRREDTGLRKKKLQPEPVPIEKVLIANGVVIGEKTGRLSGRQTAKPKNPVVQEIDVQLPEVPTLKVPADLQLFCRALTKEVITVAYEIAKNRQYRASDRLRAAELLLERGWGKAAQELNLGVAEGSQLKIDLAKLTKEEFQQMKALTEKTFNLPNPVN